MSLFDLKLSRFQLQVLAILYKTFKSAAFNVAIFVVGFGVGLAVVAMNVHQQAKRNSTWELLSQIQQQVVEMSHLDVDYAAKQRKICGLLGDLRVKIAHDANALHGGSSVQSPHGRQEKDGSRATDMQPAADVR